MRTCNLLKGPLFEARYTVAKKERAVRNTYEVAKIYADVLLRNDRKSGLTPGSPGFDGANGARRRYIFPV